jgi:hypothetical protein
LIIEEVKIMNMKLLFKTSILLVTILLFFIGISNLNAAEKLQIIQNTGGIKNFAEKDGYVEKSIIASDLENGEVTIQLLVSNGRKTEIIFILDDSTEIEAIPNLKSTLISELKTFATSLHGYSNLKTGVSFMHPYGTTTTPAINGGVMHELSETLADTTYALDTYLSTTGSDGQDFIEVLTAANNSFSETAENKLIVLLTSGIDSTHTAEYKSAIQQVETTADIVTIVVENSQPYIEEVFGTEATPTATIHYTATAADLNTKLTALSTYIAGLLPNNKYNILVEDFFTDNIINNFDIEYVGNPSKGTVGTFNTTDKKFSWTIGDLTNNSDATFAYKLKLKAGYDTSIEDIVLNTNDKAVITYKDIADANQTISYDINPTIKIVSTLINPKTGLYDYFIPAALIFCISVLTISIIKRKEVFINI